MNKTLSVTMVSLEMLEHFLKLCEASYTVGTGVEFSFHSLWLRLGRLPHLPKHPVGRQDCCVWIRRSCFAVELHSSSDLELDAPKVLSCLNSATPCPKMWRVIWNGLPALWVTSNRSTSSNINRSFFTLAAFTWIRSNLLNSFICSAAAWLFGTTLWLTIHLSLIDSPFRRPLTLS